MLSSPTSKMALHRVPRIQVERRQPSTATSFTPTVPSFSTPRACNSSNDALSVREGKGAARRPFFLSFAEHFRHGVHRGVQAVVIRRRVAIDLLERSEGLLRHDEIHAIEKRRVAVERA